MPSSYICVNFVRCSRASNSLSAVSFYRFYRVPNILILVSNIFILIFLVVFLWIGPVYGIALNETFNLDISEPWTGPD